MCVNYIKCICCGFSYFISCWLIGLLVLWTVKSIYMLCLYKVTGLYAVSLSYHTGIQSFVNCGKKYRWVCYMFTIATVSCINWCVKLSKICKESITIRCEFVLYVGECCFSKDHNPLSTSVCSIIIILFQIKLSVFPCEVKCWCNDWQLLLVTWSSWGLIV